jgi:hypothetical protein
MKIQMSKSLARALVRFDSEGKDSKTHAEAAARNRKSANRELINAIPGGGAVNMFRTMWASRPSAPDDSTNIDDISLKQLGGGGLSYVSLFGLFGNAPLMVATNVALNLGWAAADKLQQLAHERLDQP